VLQNGATESDLQTLEREVRVAKHHNFEDLGGPAGLLLLFGLHYTLILITNLI
jgi:hypothetical protein